MVETNGKAMKINVCSEKKSCAIHETSPKSISEQADCNDNHGIINNNLK